MPHTPAPNQDGSPEEASLYQQLGEEAFWRISRCFYARIDRSALLRPIFPQDLSEPIRNQAEFLIQYFGGPQAYSQRKGHPRLRLRHQPYQIGIAQRNEWVACMEGALEDAGIPAGAREKMRRYFANTATFLMNSDE